MLKIGEKASLMKKGAWMITLTKKLPNADPIHVRDESMRDLGMCFGTQDGDVLGLCNSKCTKKDKVKNEYLLCLSLNNLHNRGC